jgi:hypothetical protein
LKEDPEYEGTQKHEGRAQKTQTHQNISLILLCAFCVSSFALFAFSKLNEAED